MGHDLIIVLLLLGLIFGIMILRKVHARIDTKTFRAATFNILGGLVAFLPAILITVKFIEKTTGTVLIALAYFLVFTIGSVFINSKAFRKENDDLTDC